MDLAADHVASVVYEVVDHFANWFSCVFFFLFFFWSECNVHWPPPDNNNTILP